MIEQLELTERERLVADLREREGLTYTEIAQRCNISPVTASKDYHEVVYKRRRRKWQELWLEENQKIVSFSLKLGEVVILKRVLYTFFDWKDNCECHRVDVKRPRLEDVDYTTAKELFRRLTDLETSARRPTLPPGAEEL